MSSNNKILILFFAITAFVIGVVVNSVRVSDQIDTQTLLSAELIIDTPSQVDGSLSTVHDFLGELTLVNFWASWCAPCKEEMPIFETMYRQFKGLNVDQFIVVGVAIDSPEAAQPLLDSMGISYPILYAEQTGMQLMDSAGNPQGLMPYSLLLNQNGEVVDQVLGKINEQQIMNWISEHLPSSI